MAGANQSAVAKAAPATIRIVMFPLNALRRDRYEAKRNTGRA
jgi:hypothetical protein